MKTIHLIFFDAGGGHRSAMESLIEVIHHEQRPWLLKTLNLQELFDSFDIFKKVTGVRLQDLYNAALRRGWTLGSASLTRAMHVVIRAFHKVQVDRLREYWSKNPTDLVISLVPNFNRALFESLGPQTPLITVLTDFADFPPHFWIEKQRQYFVCGTERALHQARAAGHPASRVFRASGMIVHPRFYRQPCIDKAEGLRSKGLDPQRRTGLVLFGASGSRKIEVIIEKAAAFKDSLQLIVVCGRNAAQAEELRRMDNGLLLHVEGFTTEIPALMYLSDFLIGKPGPGSISEALTMGLPVIVERNAWTLPQERYNADWIEAENVGIVLSDYRDLNSALDRMLNFSTLTAFQQKVQSQRVRAVFEIPNFVAQVLEMGPAE